MVHSKCSTNLTHYILPIRISVNHYPSHSVICMIKLSLILISYTHFVSVPDCVCVFILLGGSSPTYTSYRVYQMGIPNLEPPLPGYTLISRNSNVLILKNKLLLPPCSVVKGNGAMRLPATGFGTEWVLTGLVSFLLS